MRDLKRLEGRESDYNSLLELVGEKRLVLLGEATHGSHEFYLERFRITKQLIEQLGFTAVAIEADWPDAYRVNRYVQGISEDKSSQDALADFRRFPSWMWRNTDVADFIEWLKQHNATMTEGQTEAGFYGLDLYSLHSSIEAVVSYLEKRDPELARLARTRYQCFDGSTLTEEAGSRYGYAVALNIATPCEDEVIAQLNELQARSAEILSRNGPLARDEYFFAEQNARLVLNAERYYRTMYRSDASSWNLRDKHMVEALGALTNHLAQRQERPKIVIWEHNSHIGDARATSLSKGGELNVGQLIRESFPDDCVLVGFTTHHGWVTAASYWGGPTERKRVRPSLRDSYEWRFHSEGEGNFLIPMKSNRRELRGPLLERAIGVIYKPETELGSHWFHANLPAQFDAVVHIDETSAVTPLERTSLWDEGEAPETYPIGL